MGETATSSRLSLSWLASHAGLVVGLAVTAMSMSSGFIWASQGEVALVYVAGFFSWTGYMFAHYAVEGVFVDDASEIESGVPDPESDSDSDGGEGDDVGLDEPIAYLSVHARDAAAGLRGVLPDDPGRAVGFIAGIVVLVVGIAILAWYVRQQNHLLGNVGSGMFLGGYVIAHYFASGKFL